MGLGRLAGYAVRFYVFKRFFKVFAFLILVPLALFAILLAVVF